MNIEKYMTIWCDKPRARSKSKGPHCVKKGQSKLKLKSGFYDDCGDVPVAVIAGDGALIPVVNNRGNAYAHRNALRYKKKIGRASKQTIRLEAQV